MATYIRTLARMVARTSRPASMLIVRQVPAAMAARQYHAFRSTQITFKGKKHAVMDGDDEELEAELQELEREKREQEALERDESSDESLEPSESAVSESGFQELYDTLLSQTSASSQHHELPRHSALFHLTQAISTKDQAQQLPQVLKQWRLRKLPISILVSHKLIHAVCKAGSPETAIELLGDRETYGLTPGQGTMRRVIRSYVKEIATGSQESEEALEKLDGAFKVMALIPYYNLRADDAAIYANLVRGSLLCGGEEGVRRASVTMDEFILIDGEREMPLTRRRAAEIVAASEQLIKTYEAGGNVDKANELKKHTEQWKESL
ncbi:hypothetical protein BGX27_009687 [Mortierella sp. AM989]|nr:hypothetical protein BGX27_009687 [Mortierella sp. AM989]